MISKLEYYFPAAGLSQNDMLHLIKGFDVSLFSRQAYYLDQGCFGLRLMLLETFNMLSYFRSDCLLKLVLMIWQI
jgi:hypothetical protein